MGSESEIYQIIRWEIITNHVLMHVTTLLVVIVLLFGTWLIEQRKSVLSVFLPLLSLAWAAAIVRFDFFIHRQGIYLRALEAHFRETGVSAPLWETWKASLRSTAFIVPIADFIALLVILLPTFYLLFGPAQEFFLMKQWRGRRAYAFMVTGLLCLLSLSLLFIPLLASR